MQTQGVFFKLRFDGLQPWVSSRYDIGLIDIGLCQSGQWLVQWSLVSGSLSSHGL